MNSGNFEKDKLLSKSEIKLRTQLLAAFAAALGGFALGTVLAYTSPAIPSLLENVEFSHLSPDQVSWFASLAPLASLCACPCMGLFTERLGRRGTLLLLNLPLIIGWILLGVGYNFWILLVGRVLTGFAGGAFSVVVPIYINETASESFRGRLGLLNTIGIPSGMSLSYIAGCFLPYNYLAIFLCSIPMLMFTLLLFVVESPRFYLCKGRARDANAALVWLRCDADVREEFELMHANFVAKKGHESKLSDVFSDRSILKPMVTCIGLMFFLVASGIDAIIFFSYSIFKDTGTDISPSMSTVAVGLVEVISIALSYFAIDRFGRKPLMILSEIAMAISLLFLGFFFYFRKSDPNVVATFGWIPLLTLTVYTFGFAFGMGSAPYVYLEVIPFHVAGLVSGIAVCFNWSVAFLVTHFFGTLKEEIGSDGTFWLFSGFCCLGAVYIYFCVPETTGKTLEEIQILFK